MRFLFALLIVPAISWGYPTLPDQVATPGATNPAVTQENIKETICVSGWTKTIRPTASYTTKLKKQQLKSGPYQSDLGSSAFEEDHRLSLEVGGHPTDPKNLWPQLWNPAGGKGAHMKDQLETAIKRKICKGELTLADGQAVLLGDWVAGYANNVRSPKYSKQITQ